MIHEGERVSVRVRKSAVVASDGSIKEPPALTPSTAAIVHPDAPSHSPPRRQRMNQTDKRRPRCGLRRRRVPGAR